MTKRLRIGKEEIKNDELISLLIKYQLLNQLAKEMIVDDNIKDIPCTEEEINQGIVHFCRSNNLMTEQQLLMYLQQAGITPEEFKQKIGKKLRLEKFKIATWEVSTESYFLANKNRLDQVIYSLLRTQDLGIAQELYFRIKEGESSFSELAIKYSQGSEAQTGGLVGPVAMNVPNPQIAEKLKASEPGKLWPPMRIGEWWLIIRLEKYIGAQLNEATKQRLLDEQFQIWVEQELKKQLVIEEVKE